MYTSDIKGAGTDAAVHLEMHGKLNGKETKSQQHTLDTAKVIVSAMPPHKCASNHELRVPTAPVCIRQDNFERCSVDTFLLKKHPKLGSLTHIVIGHDGKGLGPGNEAALSWPPPVPLSLLS